MVECPYPVQAGNPVLHCGFGLLPVSRFLFLVGDLLVAETVHAAHQFHKVHLRDFRKALPDHGEDASQLAAQNGRPGVLRLAPLPYHRAQILDNRDVGTRRPLTV